MSFTWPGNAAAFSIFMSLTLVTSSMPHNGDSHQTSGPAASPAAAAGGRHKSQQQWYTDSLPKNVTEFLDNCTDHMALECAEEVIDAILWMGSISDACCTDLVTMGIECQTSLAKLFVNSPLQKVNAPAVIANGQQIFDNCTLVDRKRRYGNTQ
ncbi:unnamed protein product [Cuscuta epithymum]|uniref:Prolamin-like domain-containing protein n=1 Tax=Cuscuta epithymum TaxID=186058 RepID=A0AAV0C6C0_9ASTE|nr:unnamed protein product [Cuscuta epithymum]